MEIYEIKCDLCSADVKNDWFDLKIPRYLNNYTEEKYRILKLVEAMGLPQLCKGCFMYAELEIKKVFKNLKTSLLQPEMKHP